MKEKLEINTIFKKLHSITQIQFQTKIQVLRTINAKEYFQSILEDYLSNNGIIHQSSYVNTPKKN